VFFLSLWAAFSWAILYLTFGSIPLVFHTSYGFTVQQSGCVFSAICIGASIATFFSIYQESLLSRWFPPNSFYHKLSQTPEARLYFTCVESILMPIGLFWFGWSSFSNVHFIIPTLAIGCSTIGIYSVYLASFNYLADTYHRYASSALAAQSFCKSHDLLSHSNTFIF
jgi:hypothetical protein